MKSSNHLHGPWLYNMACEGLRLTACCAEPNAAVNDMPCPAPVSCQSCAKKASGETKSKDLPSRAGLCRQQLKSAAKAPLGSPNQGAVMCRPISVCFVAVKQASTRPRSACLPCRSCRGRGTQGCEVGTASETKPGETTTCPWAETSKRFLLE